MHQSQHSQPDGDGPGSHLTKAIHTRSQLYVWLDRANDQIHQLTAELTRTIAERAELHEEVVYWRRRAARREGLDPNETPPLHYVEALRAEQLEPHREIAVLIDDIPWTIGLSSHRACDPDPLHELRCWQRNVIIAREVRSQAVDA